MEENEYKKLAFDRFLEGIKGVNGFKKHSDVPKDLIKKYEKIAPPELIYLWKNYGFGIYADGFLQLINPDEYEFVFDYIDKTLLPCFVFGTTALGDILIWEGQENWTVSPNEGDRCRLINIRKYATTTTTFLSYTLHSTLDKDYVVDEEEFDSIEFYAIKRQYPALEYGQCYGYVPGIPLGGSRDINNIKILEGVTHFKVIAYMMGKVEDYY